MTAKPKLDSETQKLLAENQRIANFVKGDDWAWLKELLVNRMIDIQSVLNIDAESIDKLQVDIKARRMVVEILREVIVEVEGRANQATQDQEKRDPENSTEYIMVQP